MFRRLLYSCSVIFVVGFVLGQFLLWSLMNARLSEIDNKPTNTTFSDEYLKSINEPFSYQICVGIDACRLSNGHHIIALGDGAEGEPGKNYRLYIGRNFKRQLTTLEHYQLWMAFHNIFERIRLEKENPPKDYYAVKMLNDGVYEP